jgi:hypothetical protein
MAWPRFGVNDWLIETVQITTNFCVRFPFHWNLEIKSANALVFDRGQGELKYYTQKRGKKKTQKIWSLIGFSNYLSGRMPDILDLKFNRWHLWWGSSSGSLTRQVFCRWALKETWRALRHHVCLKRHKDYTWNKTGHKSFFFFTTWIVLRADQSYPA